MKVHRHARVYGGLRQLARTVSGVGRKDRGCYRSWPNDFGDRDRRAQASIGCARRNGSLLTALGGASLKEAWVSGRRFPGFAGFGALL